MNWFEILNEHHDLNIYNFGSPSLSPVSTERTMNNNDLGLFQSPLEPAFGSLHWQNLSLQFLNPQLETLQLFGPSLNNRHRRNQSEQTDGSRPCLLSIIPFHPSAAVWSPPPIDSCLRGVLWAPSRSVLLLPESYRRGNKTKTKCFWSNIFPKGHLRAGRLHPGCPSVTQSEEMCHSYRFITFILF